MELTPYISSVRSGLRDSAALADEPTRQIVERLGDTVEASTRLALLQAITDATAEISAELAPGSVEVRVSGSDPSFVVTLPDPADHEVTELLADEVPQAAEEPEPFETISFDEDEPQARVSLRLPQSVKERVDALADEDGVSTNTWILHRILEAISLRQAGSDLGNVGQVLGSIGIDLGDLGRQIGRDWRRVARDSRRSGGFTPPEPPAPPAAPGFGFGGRNRRNGVRGWVK